MSLRLLLAAALLGAVNTASAAQVIAPRVRMPAANIGISAPLGGITQTRQQSGISGHSGLSVAANLPQLSAPEALTLPKSLAPAISRQAAALPRAEASGIAQAAATKSAEEAPRKNPAAAGTDEEIVELSPLEKSRLITPESEARVNKFLKMIY